MPEDKWKTNVLIGAGLLYVLTKNSTENAQQQVEKSGCKSCGCQTCGQK